MNQGNLIGKAFFAYSTRLITSLAAGANAQRTIQVEANSSFDIMKTVYFCNFNGSANVTAESRPLPLVTVEVTDTGSGQRLTKEPVFISNFAGFASLPLIWNQPRTVQANSSIEVSFTNLGAVAIENLQLTFLGQKVYRSGQ